MFGKRGGYSAKTSLKKNGVEQTVNFGIYEGAAAFFHASVCEPGDVYTFTYTVEQYNTCRFVFGYLDYTIE